MTAGRAVWWWPYQARKPFLCLPTEHAATRAVQITPHLLCCLLLPLPFRRFRARVPSGGGGFGRRLSQCLMTCFWRQTELCLNTIFFGSTVAASERRFPSEAEHQAIGRRDISRALIGCRRRHAPPKPGWTTHSQTRPWQSSGSRRRRQRRKAIGHKQAASAIKAPQGRGRSLCSRGRLRVRFEAACNSERRVARVAKVLGASSGRLPHIGFIAVALSS